MNHSTRPSGKLLTMGYWISTILLAASMFALGVLYLISPQFQEAFRHLGFPNYFRIELAIAKLIGSPMFVVPNFPRVREWAYAGFSITFISAFIAHMSSGDSKEAPAPLFFLIVLAVSYVTYRRRKASEFSAD